MNWRVILLTIYGLLLFVGGMIGFSTAHSLPSLIMGTSATAFVFAAAYGYYQNKVWAFYLAQIISWVLFLFFTYRYLHTQKMMPGGMMAIISFVVAALLLYSYAKEKK